MPTDTPAATTDPATRPSLYHPTWGDTNGLPPQTGCLPIPGPAKLDKRDVGEDTEEIELPTVPDALVLKPGDTYKNSALILDDDRVLRNEQGTWVPAKAPLFDLLVERLAHLDFTWEAREEDYNGRTHRYVHFTNYPRVCGRTLRLTELLALEPESLPASYPH